MIEEFHIDAFERDGFVILPQVLDQQMIKRLTAAGDRYLATDYQKNRQRSDDGVTDGFRNCVSLHKVFTELLAWPAVFPYLVRLLGPDIKLLTSHLFYRSTALNLEHAQKRAPGWHRDFYKAQRSLGHARIPRLDIKAAFCLNDLPDVNCGGTVLLPGSHLLKEAITVPENEDPAGAIEPCLRAGDCVLFENRTWHAGALNLSTQTRKVIMMGYTYVWIESSDCTSHDQQTIDWAEELYADVGLQLLGALPVPEHFDYHYDTRPVERWAEQQLIIS